jgi:hypothetical protein
MREKKHMENQYKFADFTNQKDFLMKISEYEKELKQNTGQDIVLIAYTRS